MTGLVSVSFRSLSPEQILTLMQEAGLECVEWGGDIHVPAGDPKTATLVGRLSREAGIQIHAYGSYYRIGVTPAEAWRGVLSSAHALEAPILRVWAGDRAREELSAEAYAHAVSDARRICDEARGFMLCLECHNWSLTEDADSALQFLRDVDRENLQCYWQPNQFRSHAYNKEAAQLLAPHCRGVHVFSWHGEERFPLETDTAEWRDYIRILRAENASLPFLLEFMHDDRPESLPSAAETLRAWLGENTP